MAAILRNTRYLYLRNSLITAKLYIYTANPYVTLSLLRSTTAQFYLHVLKTEASFYICDRRLTDINMAACFCVLNFLYRIVDMCYFKVLAFTTETN